MKTAILQCADQGPVESLALMLRSIGYQCILPGLSLRDELRRAGGDTILTPEDLSRDMGYDLIDPTLVPTYRATPADLLNCDLYIDVKAHRSGPKIWKRWPHLERKTLWYRINGGKPEHVIRNDGFDCGDEVNPPCPVITPNQWYGVKTIETTTSNNQQYRTYTATSWANKSYCCWPPFHRWREYNPPAQLDRRGALFALLLGEGRATYHPPICLIHNLKGWGYGALVDSFTNLGVRMYGLGSPHGLLQHCMVSRKLAYCLAYVHLKSSDAPGYALYEALAAGCPVICTRRLIWRCNMGDLFLPGNNCLVFDRETHDGLTESDILSCTQEVNQHLDALLNSKHNQEIGEAGRKRLGSLMWSPDKSDDVESLRAFMEKWYG